MGRFRLAASLALGLLACAPPHPRHATDTPRGGTPRDSFVVIGDTQRSLWAEEHVLGREQNDDERLRLIDQLVAQENPAFVVHLGDLVAKASPAHWRYFDELMAPLVDARIPLLPVLGNHEYFGEGREPTRSARRRYPDLANGGYYAKRWRRFGLVWLDTNLTGRAATRQAEWLELALRTLDAAPGVDATLVFTHHPPFTNGVDRHGHDGVRHELLPRIARSSKAVALFSAHVHGYERFKHRGLALLVSGGGGGPRVTYQSGCERCPTPATAALAGPHPRPLHYLVVADNRTTLTITTRCLDESPGCPVGGVLDAVELELSAPRRTAEIPRE